MQKSLQRPRGQFCDRSQQIVTDSIGRWRQICCEGKTIILLLLLLVACAGLLPAQDIKPADVKTYNEAVDHYGHRRYTEAAKLMRRVAGHNPRSADAQFWLGMASVKDGFNTTGIRRYFSKCIEINPAYPHPLAHFYMALVHYTDERYSDAVRELNLYFEQAKAMDDRAVNAVYEEASNYLYWSHFLADAELNRAPFAPWRVKGVSSRYDELMPFLTVDGRTMYYLRKVPVRQAATFYNREREQMRWELSFSKWLDTTFSKGVALGKPFNSGDPEGGVSLTADGTELYYSIIRKQSGYSNSDIYCVRRIDGEWQQPEALGPQVNGPASWESQPTVSADGRTLIFASNRKGGLGGIDLWRCHRLPNGDWSRAENLGSAVNTSGNEKAPFLAADGHTLYFLSDGWQGFGGYDIYFANLADAHGNRPINLGLPINTEGDEVSFGVTSDGRRAYIASRQDNATSSDVLMFDLYPAARPDPMRVVHLDVRDTAGNALAGWNTVVVPEQRDTVLLVSAEGMFPALLTVKAGRAGQKVQLRTAAVGSLHPLDLSDGLEHRLDALAAWLVEHPRVHLRVECPRRGDAQRVVDHLKSKGLRPERFEVHGGTDITYPQFRVL